jgi:two-component system, NarL family, response regulator NreC
MIADDQAVVRAGLHMLLAGEADFEVIAETADVDSTARSLRDKAPDVLVLDAHVASELGVAAVPGLVKVCVTTAIVVLTTQDDPEVARQALRSGARGYVLKHSTGVELIDAIRAAVAGETYLNPLLGARMVSEMPDSLLRSDGLTNRETEVLKLIALGHTNAEVAQHLYLSVRTVETHRSHIQQKLRLSTRAQLVRYTLDHDLLDR